MEEKLYLLISVLIMNFPEILEKLLYKPGFHKSSPEPPDQVVGFIGFSRQN